MINSKKFAIALLVLVFIFNINNSYANNYNSEVEVVFETSSTLVRKIKDGDNVCYLATRAGGSAPAISCVKNKN